MATARQAKPGEDARRAAIKLLAAVLCDKQSFDDGFEDACAAHALAARDRAFVYALVATSLRHKGEIDAVMSHFLAEPLPRSSGSANLILQTGTVQRLFMDIPAHAVIDLAVTIAQGDRNALHFARLINAVLRKVASQGPALLATFDAARINTPDWLWRRWTKCYGDKVTREIAEAHRFEPPLDLSARSDPAHWASVLKGVLLPTGTIRLASVAGRIKDLPGFAEGAWWVQDAAARLPALLLGDVAGLDVLDLCAAPGGKTAMLAARGARVTAVDKSAKRMQRLMDNLGRLKLHAEPVIGNAETFAPGKTYDAVLLDAPCSATGTIRRHPDLPYIKDDAQISALGALQTRLLDRAAKLVRKGGRLVYCTCSLEAEEGEAQIASLLKGNPEFSRQRLASADLAGQSQFINPDGDLRTHPAMAIGSERSLDGFFAARLIHR